MTNFKWPEGLVLTNTFDIIFILTMVILILITLLILVLLIV